MKDTEIRKELHRFSDIREFFKSIYPDYMEHSISIKDSPKGEIKTIKVLLRKMVP